MPLLLLALLALLLVPRQPSPPPAPAAVEAAQPREPVPVEIVSPAAEMERRGIMFCGNSDLHPGGPRRMGPPRPPRWRR